MTQLITQNSTQKTRVDFALIANWVKKNAKVLDLGCGDGALLAQLQHSHRIHGYGIEKDDNNWLAALNNGINVIQMNLEEGLSGFEDNSFDVVILSQTLQAMHHTEAIVLDMLRVGREVIVTFPNFGYWRNRVQLAIGGHMPVSRQLPYQWYDTPNVHFCTVYDFDQFCANHKIDVKERLVLTEGKPVDFAPNIRGNLALYRLQKSA